MQFLWPTLHKNNIRPSEVWSSKKNSWYTWGVSGGGKLMTRCDAHVMCTWWKWDHVCTRMVWPHHHRFHSNNFKMSLPKYGTIGGLRIPMLTLYTITIKFLWMLCMPYQSPYLSIIYTVTLEAKHLNEHSSIFQRTWEITARRDDLCIALGCTQSQRYFYKRIS